MKQFTAIQMIIFAEYCEKNYTYLTAGLWRFKDQAASKHPFPTISTMQLLDEWEKIQVPPLPTVDDLKGVRLGQENR